MEKIKVIQRQLSPGEISYQKRAAKWYAQQQARVAASGGNQQRPHNSRSMTFLKPSRGAYGEISDWSSDNF